MMAEVASRAEGSTDFPLLRSTENPTRTLVFVLAGLVGCNDALPLIVKDSSSVLPQSLP